MFKCSNVQMFKCSNVQMLKCSNVQIFKCSNVKCQMSIRLNFCRSVPPELLRSFLALTGALYGMMRLGRANAIFDRKMIRQLYSYLIFTPSHKTLKSLRLRDILFKFFQLYR